MNLKHLGFNDFLEDDEIISSVFRHPIGSTFIKVIFFSGIWGSIAWVVHFYWADYYYDYSATNQYNLLWLIPAFIGCVKVFDVFMKWYANAILMTNQSLVFSKFIHIFDRSVSRIDYFDLDDVELEKKGMTDYIGNKGDLIFSKVSGGSKEFKRVRNPRKIIRKIREHKARMLNEKNFTEEGALKDLLSQLVQTHVRGQGQPENERINNRKEKVIAETDDNSSDEIDFIKMKEEELAKLKALEKEAHGNHEITDEGNTDRNSFHITSIRKLAKKIIPKHFHNELEDNEFTDADLNIEVEKELDDEGGLEIDLD